MAPSERRPRRLVSFMTPGFPVSLFDEIARVLDAELTLVTDRSGPAPGEDPFADGAFDLGWICSTSFVDLALRSPEPSIRLAGVAWVPADPEVSGHPVYFGDVVVAAGAPARSLGDLGGRRIGCNDPVSLSGHHALRFALAERGLDVDGFAQLEFTGAHETSLDAVVAGDLDAAVVDSVVRARRAASDPDVAGLAVIDRLGPWPTQPLVVRRGISDAERSAIVSALLDAADGRLGDELRAAGLAGLVAVSDDHCEPVRRAVDALSDSG